MTTMEIEIKFRVDKSWSVIDKNTMIMVNSVSLRDCCLNGHNLVRAWLSDSRNNGLSYMYHFGVVLACNEVSVK